MTRSSPGPREFLLALLVMSTGVGCSQSNDVSAQAALEQTRGLRAEGETFAALTIEHATSDASGTDSAGRLFEARCASCHGADGRGEKGVMDLVDGSYNYGSSLEAIRDTIARGRKSTMPALGNQLGEMRLSWLVTYVESIQSDEPLSRFAERGKDEYAENCEVCHGVGGHGNPDIGAPNLADGYWLYGDETMSIRLAITRGAESECPPQADDLTAAEIDLLAAYVSGLSRRDRPEQIAALATL